MAKNYSGKNSTKFPMSQWLLSCAIIIGMLLIVYVVAFADGGTMTYQPSYTDPTATTAYNPLGNNPDVQPTGGDTPQPADVSTTASTEETTTTTTTTTTAAETQPTAVTTDMGIITAEYSNARSGPGAGYELIQKVYNGEKYKILGQANADNGVMWYKLDVNGKEAYVCGAFVNRVVKVVGGKAYLTFDDGPSKNTTKILDILDRYNVKATFFVIYSKDYSNVYKQIVDRGHTLALHSYSHDYSKIYKSQTAYFDDLEKLNDYVSGLTGVSPKIMRFPGGASNTVSRKHCKGIMTELSAEVQNRGYKYFDWNVDSGDADDTTVPKDTLVKNIKSRIGSNASACILMHDASAKTTTVDALPQIIEYLQSSGYEILPLTEDTPPIHHSINN